MIWPFLIPITGIIASVVMVIGLPLVRAYARRMEAGPQTASGDLTARLQRMEQAIDAIAVEVERISEGQRFTTKLLAERGSVPEHAVPTRETNYESR
jgi:hypothetical protein